MAGSFAEQQRRWIEGTFGAVRNRKRGKRSMAPWDENAYFQTVRESFLLMPVGTVRQVAQADPQRVVIIFSATINNIMVSTRNDGPPFNGGMVAGPLVAPIVITQAQHGPLAAQEWFAFEPAGGTFLTVIEISLREWPQ